jgi:hypothetical protein
MQHILFRIAARPERFAGRFGRRPRRCSAWMRAWCDPDRALSAATDLAAVVRTPPYRTYRVLWDAYQRQRNCGNRCLTKIFQSNYFLVSSFRRTRSHIFPCRQNGVNLPDRLPVSRVGARQGRQSCPFLSADEPARLCLWREDRSFVLGLGIRGNVSALRWRAGVLFRVGEGSGTKP